MLTGLAGPALVGAQNVTDSTVTISADRSEYTYGIDNVIFTLTRTGSVEAALTVPVTLTQDDGYLAASKLARSVTFGAHASTATLKITRFEFLTTAMQTGDLTASVVSGDEIVGGTPASATVRMVVANPAMTVRMGDASYRFAEGQTGTNVVVLARAVAGLPQPNAEFYVSVSTARVSQGASSPDDFAALSETVQFEPGDFELVGDAWQARKEVALLIVDDNADETDETLNLKLESAAGISNRVAFVEADGLTPCGPCLTPVTIVDDDDGKASAPRGLTLTPSDGAVALAWNAPAQDGGNAVTRYQYRVSVDDGTTWNPDWTDIPDSAPGELTLDIEGLRRIVADGLEPEHGIGLRLAMRW